MWGFPISHLLYNQHRYFWFLCLCAQTAPSVLHEHSCILLNIVNWLVKSACLILTNTSLWHQTMSPQCTGTFMPYLTMDYQETRRSHINRFPVSPLSRTSQFFEPCNLNYDGLILWVKFLELLSACNSIEVLAPELVTSMTLGSCSGKLNLSLLICKQD